MHCSRFLELAKFLQMTIFLREYFALAFRRFTRVAARLLQRSALVLSDSHLLFVYFPFALCAVLTRLFTRTLR